MKASLLALLCFIPAAYADVVTYTYPAPQGVQPSRTPEKGCSWQKLQAKELGVELLVQKCDAANARYEYTTNGNWIEQHRPDDDNTFVSHSMIQVLNKRPEQSVAQAIEEQIIAKLPPEARANCKVKAANHGILTSGRKQSFELVPTGAYKRKMEEIRKKEPGDFGCGDYGLGQGITYFEYHPFENKTKFLFVNYGMDAPLFDENSIRIMRNYQIKSQ